MLGLVLGNKVSRKTAKNLAKVLAFDYSENVFPYKPYNCVIRYGNTTVDDCLPEYHTPLLMINSIICVIRTAHKLSCRKLLLENGIKCPMLIEYHDLQDIRNPEFIFKPALIARPVFHARGRNFFRVNNLAKALQFVKRGYYLQEFIEKRVEYRVFIYRGRFFEVDEKVPGRFFANDVIRNHDNGWIFNKIPYKTLAEDLLEQCRKVYYATRLDWMAIDCCISKDNRPYIFEVNSAPGLIDRKLINFANRIKGELGIDMSIPLDPMM